MKSIHRLLPLPMLSVLAMLAGGCAHTDWIDITQATTARRDDGRIATTVTLWCDGDCRIHVPFCISVTWHFSGTSDTSQKCVSTQPSNDVRTASQYDLTSNVPIPATATNITGRLTLLDPDGSTLPQGEGPYGGESSSDEPLNAP